MILTCALNGTLLTFFIHPVQIRQGNLLKNNNNNFLKKQEIIEDGTACEVQSIYAPPYNTAVEYYSKSLF